MLSTRYCSPIQEHWLIPNDLHLLNNSHTDFMSTGLSAVDLSSDILVGRPFGGTAILFRKCLADKIKIVESNESRITGIQIDTNIGPLLQINVYMLTNYGDDASLESHIDCFSKLHVMIFTHCGLLLIATVCIAYNGDICFTDVYFFIFFYFLSSQSNFLLSEDSQEFNIG